jgi:branched-chain amino acid transport system ATP-binding protein
MNRATDQAPRTDRRVLLETADLRVTYGSVVAVEGLSLSVPEAGIVGLIGPNGAGKTSAIDAISGYHPLSGGSVSFEGEDMTRMRPHRRARRGLARTFQSVELFDDLTVEENLQVAADHLGIGRALRDLFLPIGERSREGLEWALQLCGLEDVAGRMPTELSAGRRKLVGVARALAQRPKVVLMDEPAAGLDTDESKELGERLKTMPAAGVSVLIVDHDMSLVLGICDEIHVLDFGRSIAHGTPAAIRADESVIAAYLGGEKVAHAG